MTGLEQRNALARPLLPPDGVVGGNSPSGGDRGEREGCKGRDGHPQVAGADLAYQRLQVKLCVIMHSHYVVCLLDIHQREENSFQ